MVSPDQLQLTGGSVLFLAQSTLANHFPSSGTGLQTTVPLPQESSTHSALLRPQPSGPTSCAGDWDIAFADTHRATTQSSRRRPPLFPAFLPIDVTGVVFPEAPVEAVQSPRHSLLTGTMAVPWPHAGAAYLLLRSSLWSCRIQDDQLGVLFSSESQTYMY